MTKCCKFIVIEKKSYSGSIYPLPIGGLCITIPETLDRIKIGLYPDNESIMSDFLKLRELLNIQDKPIRKSHFSYIGSDYRRYFVKRENRRVTTDKGYELFNNLCDFKSVDELLKSDKNILISKKS